MNYTYIDDDLKAEKLINLLSADAPFLYPFDIETSGLSPFSDDILLIQFQRFDGDIYIINCRKVSIYYQLNILKAMWKNGDSSLLGHNLKFDLSFLIQKFPEIYFYKVRDTYITEQLITMGLVMKPPSLVELVKKYLNITITKEVRSDFINFKGNEFSKKQLEYGATDIGYLRKIYEEQSIYIKKYQLSFIEEVESRFVPAIAKIEINGLYVNHTKWQQNEIIAREKKFKILESMNNFAIEQGLEVDVFNTPTIKWTSPKQLLTFLRTVVDKDIKDTNEKTLEVYSHPFIDMLLEFREYEKLITGYGETVLGLINPVTKRLHPNFHQLGTKTGRLSCRNPNVQQVPKVSVTDDNGIKHMIYREAFQPQHAGGKIVGADYSSFELRVLTDLTKEPEWIKGYTEGKDMHSVVASFIFGVPVSKKQNPELRDIGKSINFGIAYGMGATKLLKSVQSIYRAYNIHKEITILDASTILRKFFTAFRNIRDWQNAYVKETLEIKRMVNPYDGRILFIEGKDWSSKSILASVSNEAKNYPCQSTNATVLKIAAANLIKTLFFNKVDAKIINLIHDEILAETKNENDAHTIAPLLKSSMESAAEFFIKIIPVKADPYIADYWKKE